MKKQKITKLKRLIFRIASVVSIISVLLCSVCFSVSADNARFDRRELYGYKGDYVMKQCGVGTGYISNPPSGTNGTVFSRSTRYSVSDQRFICYMSNTPNSDIDISLTANPSGVKHLFVQLQFNDYYTFYSDVNYNVSLPFELVFYNFSDVPSNGVYGLIRQDKLSLISYESDSTSYYDIWDVTYVSISSNWRFTLDFNFTPTSDFQCNGMGFGFNIQPRVSDPGLGEMIISSIYQDPLIISPSPIYVMPDFSNQNDIDQSEREWINNNGDMLDYLDQYYSGFENLASEFNHLIPRLFKFSLLFNSVIVRNGSFFNDILAFAVVIGVSALLINVIGQVGSFISRSTSNAFKGGRKK